MPKATKSSSPAPEAPRSDPRLEAALGVFKRGDYVRARALLAPLVADGSRPEGERVAARRLLDATRIDRAVPLTALACAALLALVAVLTAVFQP